MSQHILLSTLKFDLLILILTVKFRSYNSCIRYLIAYPAPMIEFSQTLFVWQF